MAGEVDEQGWQELSREVQGELAAWRRAMDVRELVGRTHAKLAHASAFDPQSGLS